VGVAKVNAPVTVNVTPELTVTIVVPVVVFHAEVVYEARLGVLTSIVSVNPALAVRASPEPGRFPVPAPPDAAPAHPVKLAVALHVPEPVCKHAASALIALKLKNKNPTKKKSCN
jgi:hypothetical protein